MHRQNSSSKQASFAQLLSHSRVSFSLSLSHSYDFYSAFHTRASFIRALARPSLAWASVSSRASSLISLSTRVKCLRARAGLASSRPRALNISWSVVRRHLLERQRQRRQEKAPLHPGHTVCPDIYRAWEAYSDANSSGKSACASEQEEIINILTCRLYIYTCICTVRGGLPLDGPSACYSRARARTCVL